MTTSAALLDRTDLPEPPALLGFDHLHWWVGNARHAAFMFIHGFGFRVVAYAGPETGARDRQSYVLEAGRDRFVVTSSLDSDSEIAEHVRIHGDGVRDVAYTVGDAQSAYRSLVRRGATPHDAPVQESDEAGRVVIASVDTYGTTVHSLVERSDYAGCFLPGYESVPVVDANATHQPQPNLTGFDHVVANVEDHRLDQWVSWYETVFGMGQMQHFSEDAISTTYSALRSTVVWNGGRVVQPINEPAPGLRRSQIEEYLDYYQGPGVQHIALSTADIVGAVGAMRANGVRFLRVPDDYYAEAPARLGSMGADLPWAKLAELGILVDRDDDGYLLQIFTENVASRPTVFLEIVQREGARGFGEGNFKALFTAIEAEQSRRGNL